MANGSPNGGDLIHALNDRFARLAGWSFDHRWLVVAFSVGLVFGLGALASGARIDNSYESYFDVEDTTYAKYEQYREDFGSDEISYVLYEAPDAEHGVFDLGVMRQIEQLTAALVEEVPLTKTH